MDPDMRERRVHRWWVEGILLVIVIALAVSRLFAGGPEKALPTAEELRHRVDVNRAPWHELVNLPGIGEAKAREIVRDREIRGPFRALDDLDRVPGIGPETVRRIQALASGGS